MNRLIPILAIALLLGACSETKPISPDLASLGHRIYARPIQGVPATVIFVRDIGFVDLGRTAYVTVDDELAAELETAEKVEIDMTAGNHVFGVAKSAASGSTVSIVDVTLEPGKTYVYRLISDASGLRIQDAIK